MKTLRFKVGDLARVVNSVKGESVGLIARVEEVAPRITSAGFHVDYLISISGFRKSQLDSGFWCTHDEWLEPLPPDADHLPPAVRSIFNVTPNQGLPVGPRPKEKAVGR